MNVFLKVNGMNSLPWTHFQEEAKKIMFCASMEEHALPNRSLGSKVSEGFFLAHTRPRY